MKYKAVIFDLFGTLIEKFSLREGNDVLGRMASVLGAPLDDFRRLYFSTFNERGLGVFRSIEENIEYIGGRLGLHPEDSKIKLAGRIDLEYTARLLKPRQGATEVLSNLKAQGYKTGLISDCSTSIPGMLSSLPFISLIDVPVFSSFVGILKPDPRIYKIALERLAVTAGKCLYIGDGDDQELTGAAQAGMHPVLIRDPYEDSTDVHRVGAEAKDWDGPAISSLREVLDLVKEGGDEV